MALWPTLLPLAGAISRRGYLIVDLNIKTKGGMSQYAGSNDDDVGTNDASPNEDDEPDELRQRLRLNLRLPQLRGEDEWSEETPTEDEGSSAPSSSSSTASSTFDVTSSQFSSHSRSATSSHDLLRRLSADGRLELTSTGDEDEDIFDHPLQHKTSAKKTNNGGSAGSDRLQGMEADASPDWSSSDDATSHERRQERRSYRISTMGAPAPARSFDEPRSGREDRRRAVLGDEAAGVCLCVSCRVVLCVSCGVCRAVCAVCVWCD